MLYCGICHSDLHSIKNDWGFSFYPLVPGYFSFKYFLLILLKFISPVCSFRRRKKKNSGLCPYLQIYKSFFVLVCVFFFFNRYLKLILFFFFFFFNEIQNGYVDNGCHCKITERENKLNNSPISWDHFKLNFKI